MDGWNVRRPAAARLVVVAMALVLGLSGCASAAPTPGPSRSPAPVSSIASPALTPAATATRSAPPAPLVTVGPDGIEFAVSKKARLASSDDAGANAGSAVDEFGFALFRAAAPRDGNVVLSPTSVALALAMARAGAKGQTAAEMDQVLRSLGADASGPWIASLSQALEADNEVVELEGGRTAQVKLAVANTCFAQRGMPLQPAYVDTLAERFGAGVGLVDFEHETEQARQLINAWVKARTAGRIPNILNPDDLTSLSRIALVNAMYLKGDWQWRFDPKLTHADAFRRPDGSSVNVPTMHMQGALSYAAGAGWRAVELPYAGDRLAMTIVIPDQMASFEETLSAATLEAIAGAMLEHPVTLSLPKFSAGSRLSLKPVLTAMGMPTAFAAAADFSGITAEEPLHIDAVIHQANIDVGETGTEAAAATVVIGGTMGGGMDPTPVTLRVDRPFLFYVRDLQTNAILFLGRIDDPSLARAF